MYLKKPAEDIAFVTRSGRVSDNPPTVEAPRERVEEIENVIIMQMKKTIYF